MSKATDFNMGINHLRTWTVFHICLFITFLVSSFIINVVQAVLYVSIGLVSKQLYRTINSFLVWQIHAQVRFYGKITDPLGLIAIRVVFWGRELINSANYSFWTLHNFNFRYCLLEVGGVTVIVVYIVATMHSMMLMAGRPFLYKIIIMN